MGRRVRPRQGRHGRARREITLEDTTNVRRHFVTITYTSCAVNPPRATRCRRLDRTKTRSCSLWRLQLVFNRPERRVVVDATNPKPLNLSTAVPLHRAAYESNGGLFAPKYIVGLSRDVTAWAQRPLTASLLTATPNINYKSEPSVRRAHVVLEVPIHRKHHHRQ